MQIIISLRKIFTFLLVIIALYGFATSAFAQNIEQECISQAQEDVYKRFAQIQDRGSTFINLALLPEIVPVVAQDICVENLKIDNLNDDSFTTLLSQVGTNLQQKIGIQNLVNQNTDDATVASCFNYYTFGSVIPHLSIGVDAVVSGTTMYINGTLENTNPYPIVDGSLYIKIAKKKAGSVDLADATVIDQFFAMENVSIDAKSVIPVSFEWDVPLYVQSGQYELITFFSVSKRYNVIGIPFTDDIGGPRISFDISGEQSGGIFFEKDSVIVGEREHYFSGYPQILPEKGSIIVQAKVTNTTNKDVYVPLTWQVYDWDQQRRENIVSQHKEQILVKKGTSQDVSYTVTDTKRSVYLLVAELDYQDTHSILNVPFVRKDIKDSRIHFAGITEFPLQPGRNTILFACAHSLMTPFVDNGEIYIAAMDRNGNEIYSTTYAGDISGQIFGVGRLFFVEKTYDYVELVTQLFVNNLLVEDNRIVYDCEKINKDSCSDEPGVVALFFPQKEAMLGAVVVLVIVLSLGWYIIYSRRNSQSEGSI